MINKYGGGGQFFYFMGRHNCYEGGHRAHGVPPPGKTPVFGFEQGKTHTHTVTLVLHKQKVHSSIVSTIIFFSYTA